MRSLKYILGILIISSLLITGCGKIDASNNSANEKKIEKSNTDTSVEEKEIYTTELTPDKEYNDNDHIFGIMGLKEYKKFESDKYKDTPKKGNIYLVLFLKYMNMTEENFYINTANFESKVDGKTLEHTVVFNDPEGYPTFFRNYEPKTKQYGFIVWEVAKDWKTLDISYTGLEYVNQNRITISLTKDDLKDPKTYEEVPPK